MSEEVENDTGAQGSDPITEGFSRVWSEIKQISKQVERETRKSGRAARLKLDMRRLRGEENEVRTRLGKAVYEARQEHGDAIALQDVEGFAGGVAALDALGEEIAAKEAEVNALLLRGPAADPSMAESEEVA